MAVQTFQDFNGGMSDGKCPFFNAMQYAVKRQGKREYRAMRTLLR